MCIKFWSENLKGRDLPEDLNIDGTITAEWILGDMVGRYGLDAEDRDQWWAVVNMVMNLQVP